MAPSDDRIIVGVDFGTTFTGVAIVYSKTPEDVEIIKSWPGSNGITSDKVPTEISYSQEATAEGLRHAISPRPRPTQVHDIRWGFQIKPDEARIKCIKLFLDRNQRLPDWVSSQDMPSLLLKHDRLVVDAVADFLAKIYQHVLETLKRRYGETFVGMTTIQFVLTVPAIWSDPAKHATLEAAERAGMGKGLKLISEPEAAAVYTLKVIRPRHLEVGDNFVVCDAGGGTVDLISYRITQLVPLKVQESHVGSGGLCGGTLLNFRFEDHVRSRMGVAAFTEMLEHKPKAWQVGMKNFEEYVKRNFAEEMLDEDFNIPLPGIADNAVAGIECGFLILTARQVRDIFLPVVEDVVHLVEAQIASLQSRGERVSAIVLVGGFGQSSYLYAILKDRFATYNPPPSYSSVEDDDVDENGCDTSRSKTIEIMQPVNAWTAVVRGAVERGLEGTIVEERKARYHYGIKVNSVFDPEKHPASSKYYDEHDNVWRCKSTMRWYVVKGESVSVERLLSFPFYNKFFQHEERKASSTVYTCVSEEAPVMYDSSIMSKCCRLDVDLSGVARNLFYRKTLPGGRQSWKLSYDLEMKIDSATLDFTMKIADKSYGTVKASFDP